MASLAVLQTLQDSVKLSESKERDAVEFRSSKQSEVELLQDKVREIRVKLEKRQAHVELIKRQQHDELQCRFLEELMKETERTKQELNRLAIETELVRGARTQLRDSILYQTPVRTFIELSEENYKTKEQDSSHQIRLNEQQRRRLDELMALIVIHMETLEELQQSIQNRLESNQRLQGEIQGQNSKC